MKCRAAGRLWIDPPSDNHPRHRFQDLQSHTYQCRRSLRLHRYCNYQIEYRRPQRAGRDWKLFFTHVFVDWVTVQSRRKDETTLQACG